jgi:hypothetical protein
MPSRQAPRSSPLRTSAQRFHEAQREIQQVDYFLKGTVLKRMMKCGQPQCACHRNPAKRHGPYFEWTYKANGKTVNTRLSPQVAPLYQAVTVQAVIVVDFGEGAGWALAGAGDGSEPPSVNS